MVGVANVTASAALYLYGAVIGTLTAAAVGTSVVIRLLKRWGFEDSEDGQS